MSLTDTWGSDEYCEADECGRYTPACAHAHDVSPEQSNPTLGSAEPHTYGAPSTDWAAAIAVWAPVVFGGGVNPPPPS